MIAVIAAVAFARFQLSPIATTGKIAAANVPQPKAPSRGDELPAVVSGIQRKYRCKYGQQDGRDACPHELVSQRADR